MEASDFWFSTFMLSLLKIIWSTMFTKIHARINTQCQKENISLIHWAINTVCYVNRCKSPDRDKCNIKQKYQAFKFSNKKIQSFGSSLPLPEPQPTGWEWLDLRSHHRGSLTVMKPIVFTKPVVCSGHWATSSPFIQNTTLQLLHISTSHHPFPFISISNII